jgi:hypothetical protein
VTTRIDTLQMRAGSALAGRLPLRDVETTMEELARFFISRQAPTLKMEPSIQLASGRWFDYADPDSTPLDVEDIAHALAHICRFTGHITNEEVGYSVAQHSVLASLNCPQDPLGALMHDAAEAVLGDVNSPLKQMLPDYKRIEERVERSIAATHGLAFPMTPAIKVVDLRMCATEVRDLMWTGPTDGAVEWLLPEPFDFHITPWSIRDAKHAFLARWAELTDKDAPK